MIEQAIAAKLKATAGVSAIAGTRIWQLKLPQGGTFPAVRVQLISEPETSHLRGDNRLYRSRVQIDAYVSESSGYTLATNLGAAIDGALTGGDVFVQGAVSVSAVFRENRTVQYEEAELRLIRVIQDFIVWWREAA